MKKSVLMLMLSAIAGFSLALAACSQGDIGGETIFESAIETTSEEATEETTETAETASEENSEGESADPYFDDGTIVLIEDDKIKGYYTELQREFIEGEFYRDTSPLAIGAISYEKPLGVTFSWEAEGFTEYSFYISENKDMSGAKTVVTDQTECVIYNLKCDYDYYWQVRAIKDDIEYSSKIAKIHTETGEFRLINTTVQNMRDLGGKYTADGRIKQGLVYRSARFNENKTETVKPFIDEQTISYFTEELGIKTEIDLRRTSNNEVGALTVDTEKGYGVGVLGEGVKYYQRPMEESAMLSQTSTIKSVFDIFADENNYPIVFHCAVGTDRTGVIAFLLNAFLGASKEALYKDYLLSCYAVIGSARVAETIDAYISEMGKYEGETLAEQTKNYLLSIGVSENSLRFIKQFLTEESGDNKRHTITYKSEYLPSGKVEKVVTEGYEVDCYIPEKAGYKFVKWVLEGTDEEFSGGKYLYKTDIEVNAVWEKRDGEYWTESGEGEFSSAEEEEGVFCNGVRAYIISDAEASDGYALFVSGAGFITLPVGGESESLGLIVRIKSYGSVAIVVDGATVSDKKYGGGYKTLFLSVAHPTQVKIVLKERVSGYAERAWIDYIRLASGGEGVNYDFSALGDSDMIKVSEYNNVVYCDIVEDEEASDGYALKALSSYNGKGSGVTINFDEIDLSEYYSFAVIIRNTKKEINLAVNGVYCEYKLYGEYTSVDVKSRLYEKTGGTILSSVSFYSTNVPNVEIYIDKIDYRLNSDITFDYDFSSPDDDDLLTASAINGATLTGIVEDGTASDGYALKCVTSSANESGVVINFGGIDLSQYSSITITFRAINEVNPSQQGIGVYVYGEKSGQWISLAAWGNHTVYESADMLYTLTQNGEDKLTYFRIVRNSVSNIQIFVDGVKFERQKTFNEKYAFAEGDGLPAGISWNNVNGVGTSEIVADEKASDGYALKVNHNKAGENWYFDIDDIVVSDCTSMILRLRVDYAKLYLYIYDENGGAAGLSNYGLTATDDYMEIDLIAIAKEKGFTKITKIGTWISGGTGNLYIDSIAASYLIEPAVNRTF